jgi:hypothetical protein
LLFSSLNVNSVASNTTAVVAAVFPETTLGKRDNVPLIPSLRGQFAPFVLPIAP